jgi:hypothetical protein
VQAWISHTHNADLFWNAAVLSEDDPHASTAHPVYTGVTVPPDGCLRPLLDALDDPARFAVAHVTLSVLTHRWNRPDWYYHGGIYPDAGQHAIVAVFDDMRFNLPPDSG